MWTRQFGCDDSCPGPDELKVEPTRLRFPYRHDRYCYVTIETSVIDALQGSANVDAELEEKDRTDMGLSNPMSDEALATLRERSRRRREDAPVGPPALPEQRSRAMEWLAQELGWTRPSQSPMLAKPCPTCGAAAATWCRIGLRTIAGKLCNERGTA